MKISKRFRSAALGTAAILTALFTGGEGVVLAQELRIATSYKLMTLDPQFVNLNENSSLLSQIYERLVYQDEKFDLKPGLATSWKRLSDTQWEFCPTSTPSRPTWFN